MFSKNFVEADLSVHIALQVLTVSCIFSALGRDWCLSDHETTDVRARA